MSKEAPMTPREAMETVLEAAKVVALNLELVDSQNEKKDEIREAIHLMEVYMNAKGMRGYKKVI